MPLALARHFPERASGLIAGRSIPRPFTVALRTTVFTMHAGAAVMRQCLRAGASAFVTKNSLPDSLVAAVRRVARGQIGISDDIARGVVDDGGGLGCDELSPNEFAVMQRLIDGRRVDEIAKALQLSAKTVSNYQTGIRRKIGVRSGVELVEYARRNRIAPL